MALVEPPELGFEKQSCVIQQCYEKKKEKEARIQSDGKHF